jgi:hypothetical protein
VSWALILYPRMQSVQNRRLCLRDVGLSARAPGNHQPATLCRMPSFTEALLAVKCASYLVFPVHRISQH